MPSRLVTNLSDSNTKQKILTLLLLLLSGNVECRTPAEFKSRSGLGIIHINVRSILSKLDMINILCESTNAYMVVISETWLTKSVQDNDILFHGYNVFRADRQRKGGGVVIYIKSHFGVQQVLTKSVSKELELLFFEHSCAFSGFHQPLRLLKLSMML